MSTLWGEVVKIVRFASQKIRGISQGYLVDLHLVQLRLLLHDLFLLHLELTLEDRFVNLLVCVEWLDLSRHMVEIVVLGLLRWQAHWILLGPLPVP